MKFANVTDFIHTKYVEYNVNCSIQPTKFTQPWMKGGRIFLNNSDTHPQ